MLDRIGNEGGNHPVFGVLAELAAIINDYSKKYHHDASPGKADSEPLSDGELQTYAQKTLCSVGGY